MMIKSKRISTPFLFLEKRCSKKHGTNYNEDVKYRKNPSPHSRAHLASFFFSFYMVHLPSPPLSQYCNRDILPTSESITVLYPRAQPLHTGREKKKSKRKTNHRIKQRRKIRRGLMNRMAR